MLEIFGLGALIVINIAFKLRWSKNKSSYNTSLVKFDLVSREISCTLEIDPLNFEVGSRKLEVGTQKSEIRRQNVKSRNSEVGIR